MISNSLILRADATVQIGTGHVMRSLALAQAWKDAGGECVFASAQCTPALQQRIRDEGFEYFAITSVAGSEEDAREVGALARNRCATWVVVDGYHFGSRYQDRIKERNLDLVFVDDNGHAGRYSADLVLNQNLHASTDLYRDREGYTQLLLGPSFAMLRREFDKWRNWERDLPTAGRKLLITMGGSDPQNLTESVISGLDEVCVKDLSAIVAIGASNPNRETLEQAASKSRTEIQFVENPEMPELMAWADLAISAAGSTCWEMCLLGLPAVIIPVADNQVVSAAKLDVLGAFSSIPPSDLSGPKLAEEVTELLSALELRSNMSRIARSLVDGNGAHRVVSAMMKNVTQLVH